MRSDGLQHVFVDRGEFLARDMRKGGTESFHGSHGSGEADLPRASKETDLMKSHPIHVVDAWLALPETIKGEVLVIVQGASK